MEAGVESGFFDVGSGGWPVRLYFRVHYPSHKTANAHNVFCVMGFLTEGFAWGPTIERLCSLGYRVCVFDNRGCGRSDAPWGRYTTSLIAHDAMTLLSRCLRWNPQDTHLLTISMGGMVGLEMVATLLEGGYDTLLPPSAPNQPHAPPAPPARRFLSLSLLVTQAMGWTTTLKGTPPLATVPTTLASLLPVLSPQQRATLQLSSLVGTKWLRADSGQVHPRTGQPLTNQQALMRRSAKEFYAKKAEGRSVLVAPSGLVGQAAALATHSVSRERLAKIAASPMPVLVVAATNDKLVRFTSQRFLADKLVPFEALFLEGAGHVVIEECRDHVNGAIERLFAHAEAPNDGANSGGSDNSGEKKVAVTVVHRAKV